MEAGGVLEAIVSDEQALEFVEAVTENVGAVQERVLQTIVENNADCEYLSSFGISSSSRCDDFRRLVPLATYGDIESDVQRIAEGDTSAILSTAPIREMLSSSGTSGGKQKLFPKSLGYDSEFVVLNRIARAALSRQAPESSKGKSMQFIYVRKPGITNGGVITCSGLSGYFTSPAFRNRRVDPDTGFTSPDEVILCVDYHQASYAHLLCGLIHSHQVTSLGAVFASTFIRTMKTFRECWRELVDDIRTGTVSSDRITDLSVRDAVRRLLKPNPELADAIRRECGKPSWRGIIRRLFPNAKLVQSIVTGSMQQYVPIIDMLTDGLPIASSLYASSECSTLGVNLRPVCSPSEVAYTVFPCFAYYEFLPVDKAGVAEELVELADVQLGVEYELVVTTMAGLYRYRVGDVLRVVSFHNKAPQFRFVRRAGVLLSVDTDKTDELELHVAVSRASQLFRQGDVQLLDYTSRVELSKSQPGHYVLYWELSSSAIITSDVSQTSAKLQQCCSIIESSLSVVYQRNRREGSVGALEMKLVACGTFDRIVEYVVVNRQGSIAQYKTPRCARDPAIVEILESNTIFTSRAGHN